ncbi:MAG TPA: 3-phosphoglycerate dehydrogenase [candidate division WOR-3 bacterium]|uniref:3-phosphoglycerate dehydrogenase n=1 Tax=candidate division WOR-3 bacterium TaxID=2052148 RepID=A0A7V0T454_UNCW3|nr:3-phosphoglycerate dehydrogenase [candidate division WOR-3 bacterium]
MKVIITDPIAAKGVELLKAAGIEVTEQPGLPPDELIKAIPAYDAIIVRSATKVTAEVINAGTNLKCIGRAGVGLDNVDRKAAEAKGIKVVNTPTATSITVAELALGMMLSCARSIPQATASMRAGKWEKKQFKGTELYGKTLGLIGSGRIGTELAKRAEALGMTVLVVDPYVKDAPYGRVCPLEEMLPAADYISLHVPRTEETYHIINRDTIARMKKGVFIVNCARGGVVDEEALFEALQSGQVGMAALDVYETEPVKDFKLYSLPNVIGTPHVGAQTKEGQERAGIGIAEKVRDALLGA